MVDDSRAKRVGITPGAERRGSGIGANQCSNMGLEFLGPAWTRRQAGACLPKPQKPFAPKQIRLLSLFCVPIGVNGRETIPLFRQILEGKNGGHRADRDASSTIDTFGGMDIQLCLTLEIPFILARMNAVPRADIHTNALFPPHPPPPPPLIP